MRSASWDSRRIRKRCHRRYLSLIHISRAVLGGAGEGTLISSRPFYNPGVTNISVLVAGGALACFSFLGFDSITTMAEEAVRPKKDIGRAAVIACIAGGIIFILQAYVAQLAWPDYTSFESADTSLCLLYTSRCV